MHLGGCLCIMEGLMNGKSWLNTLITSFYLNIFHTQNFGEGTCPTWGPAPHPSVARTEYKFAWPSIC
jgi:hypothetical protein